MFAASDMASRCEAQSSRLVPSRTTRHLQRASRSGQISRTCSKRPPTVARSPKHGELYVAFRNDFFFSVPGQPRWFGGHGSVCVGGGPTVAAPPAAGKCAPPAPAEVTLCRRRRRAPPPTRHTTAALAVHLSMRPPLSLFPVFHAAGAGALVGSNREDVAAR